MWNHARTKFTCTQMIESFQQKRKFVVELSWQAAFSVDKKLVLLFVPVGLVDIQCLFNCGRMKTLGEAKQFLMTRMTHSVGHMVRKTRQKSHILHWKIILCRISEKMWEKSYSLCCCHPTCCALWYFCSIWQELSGYVWTATRGSQMI